MEKLTKIEQLTPGMKFSIIDGADVTNYEFMCIHPHNDKYILALESLSQEAKKLYIPNICSKTSHLIVLVGSYDSRDIAEQLIIYYNKKIRFWSEFLKPKEDRL